ncbi:hypothetical protein ACFW16_03515 [Inquilinus sp. NPDC058860]|uniref:hypothetical protein n=1 Tax=Inquilinus sp. NPDC058860 TaxID=3346652 RepID=UPI00369F6FE3
MPVLPGGDAANDNQPVRAAGRPCLRLNLVPDPWSVDHPAAATAAWIGEIWCDRIESRPAPDLRLMPTIPD